MFSKRLNAVRQHLYLEALNVRMQNVEVRKLSFFEKAVYAEMPVADKRLYKLPMISIAHEISAADGQIAIVRFYQNRRGCLTSTLEPH